ncbi:protein NATD1-like protein, partial [Leptotrombidium deliense]
TVNPKISAQRMAAFSTEALKVLHNEKNKEFYINLGKAKAFLSYEYVNKATVDLQHTQVPVELQGKGIAKVLAKKAFDFVVDNNLQMKVTCTYLQKYLKENPNEMYSKRVVQ